MPNIPKQQCMECGEFKSIEDLQTSVSYPDPRDKSKRHVAVVCTECKNRKPDPRMYPPVRKW